MQQVNLYTLCEIYHKLSLIPPGYSRRSVAEEAMIVFHATQALESLLASSEFPIKVSRPRGERLLKEFMGYLEVLRQNIGNKEYTQEESEASVEVLDAASTSMNQAYRPFMESLSIELPEMDTFHLTQSGVYSVKSLLEMHNNIFDEQARKRLPLLTLTDLRAAGVCLAFDLYTAFGFHILRASEATLKEYLNKVGCKGDEIARAKSWYDFANLLRPKGDPEIVQLVDAIRPYYRNPIMHPEMVLDKIQANTLFALCQSLLHLLIQHLY